MEFQTKQIMETSGEWAFPESCETESTSDNTRVGFSEGT